MRCRRRVEAHTGGVDVGLTYGWIRSKLPVVDVDPSLALLPRWSWELDDAWSLGLAASFFPRLRDPTPRDGPTLADVTLGRDYVETFVRFRR